MAGRSREVGIIKSGLLAAALVGSLALPAKSAELALSGFASFTTDYLFRGVSQTSQSPAVQPEFDLTWGIFYAGIWGSNVAYADSIEIDYYAGITPKWNNITFNFAGLYYSYPGFNSVLDYFEAKAGATWTGGQWTISVNDYWSPDNFQIFGQSNAIEGSLGYAFNGKLWNFFSPSISGGVGYQSYEEVASNYTYWNAGLTLGFLERWSADIRYWDTSYSENDCFIQSGGRGNCDARAVGTLKATF